MKTNKLTNTFMKSITFLFNFLCCHENSQLTTDGPHITCWSSLCFNHCQFFLSLRQQSTQDLLCSVDGYFCTISALPPQKIWGDVNSHKFCTYHQFYLWDQIFFLKLRGLLQSNWSILCPSSLFPALSLLQHGLAVVLCRVVILA